MDVSWKKKRNKKHSSPARGKKTYKKMLNKTNWVILLLLIIPFVVAISLDIEVVNVDTLLNGSHDIALRRENGI